MKITIAKYPSIKLQGPNSLFLQFKYNPELLARIKSLPCRQYIAENKIWEIPLTDIDRLVDAVGIANITCYTYVEEYEQYVNRAIYQNVPKTVEELREYYATLVCEVDYPFKSKPMGHQIESFNFALHNDSFYITDLMGLGKTKQALDIMDYKIYTNQIHHVLVICGVNKLKYNWHNEEIPKHSRYNSQIIEGTKQAKLKKLQNFREFQYTVINVESIRMPEVIDFLEYAFNSGGFGAIIVDEFHKLNNHTSKQGKNVRKLQCQYKIGLSGTPITKSPEKSWNMLNWFGYEQSSFWNFRKRYCIVGDWGIVGYQNLPELHERFDRFQIRRTKEFLNLPEKTYATSYIDLEGSFAKDYSSIKAGILMQLEEEEIIDNPAVIVLRLRQFLEQVKIDHIIEDVKEILENGNSCVVFSCFKDNLYILRDKLVEDKIYPKLIVGGEMKDEEVSASILDFQTNNTPEVMIGTIQMLGTGFTLTKSSYVLFMTKDWVVTNNEQAEDRCHRIGSLKNVTVKDYCVRHTVDERVNEILEYDKQNIDLIVDGKMTKKSNRDVIEFLLS